MRDSEIPYFLTNSDWYTEIDILKDGFPDDDRGYHLTDKAPQEAIESYNEFYSDDITLDDIDDIDIENIRV